MRYSPKIILIDFSESIKNYRTYKGLYDLYRYFPLQDIMAFVLSIPAFIDYEEMLRNETERRCSAILDDLDIINVDFFYQLMASDLDEQICRYLPEETDSTNYEFVKWLDRSTAMLRLG